MKKKDKLYRVVTFLDREELDFVDGLVKDIYFEYGIKIPRAKLLEEIVEALKHRGSKNKESIEQELVRMFIEKGE
ncbi:MAG TPA: hypothetical protein ENH41_04985 [Candidatus Omnitrophica bacterium]|nr:hypothetical protein [Candidatus Omnitrophota bacterium]